MFYITGDIHGSIWQLHNATDKLKEEDTLVLLGDAGFNYYLNKKDNMFKREANDIGITLFCIRGNHEKHPAYLPNYKTKKWNGGIVYYEEEYPNILFAKDGDIFTLDGKTCAVIGGAYSVDKYYRLSAGYAWFDTEQLSEEEKIYVEKNLAEKDWKVDIVLSHTCPIKTQPTHLFLSCIDQSTVDNSTEIWLQSIAEKLSFDKWYFGHFHDDWENGKYQMLFKGLMELK